MIAESPSGDMQATRGEVGLEHAIRAPTRRPNSPCDARLLFLGTFVSIWHWGYQRRSMKWIALALTGGTYALLLFLLTELQFSASERRFHINVSQQEFDLLWVSKRIISKSSQTGIPVLSVQPNM